MKQLALRIYRRIRYGTTHDTCIYCGEFGELTQECITCAINARLMIWGER